MLTVFTCMLMAGRGVPSASPAQNPEPGMAAPAMPEPEWPIVPKAQLWTQGARGTAFVLGKSPAFEAVYDSRVAGPLWAMGAIRATKTGSNLTIQDATRNETLDIDAAAALDIAGEVREGHLHLTVAGKPIRGWFTLGSIPKGASIKFLNLSTPGALLGLAAYPRPMSAAQMRKAADRANDYAKWRLAPTPTATLRLELGAYTPVPDPARMKPYRTALLAQDYTVLSYVKGRLDGVKVGDKLRVFRYGVLEGKKTALKDLKTGDRVTITIELLTADPILEKEYQLDTLDTTYNPYFVEVPTSKS